MYMDYFEEKDFIGMDMCRKFLEMGFTRARRYANHNSGRKYHITSSEIRYREILPQEEDHMTSKYAVSARIFKGVRDIVAKCDIFTCSDKCLPEKAVEYMKEAFKATEVTSQEHERI